MGYALYIAFWYWLFVPRPWIVLLSQVILSIGSIWLAYSVTLRVFGEKSAIVAALLFAIYPNSILLSSTMMIETIYILFVFIFLYIYTMLYANIAFAITFGLLATVLMIGLPPSYRLYGYLVAEFIAHLPNYLIIDRRIRKVIGSPNYRIVALWIGAITCLLIAPLVSWWFSLAGVLLLLSPPSRRQIAQHYKELRRYRDREPLYDE
jgi:PST family polysaccharide transporter